jgi:hypothetical protein
MIHIRFRGPFDFPAANGELKANESEESEQGCFHRAIGAEIADTTATQARFFIDAAAGCPRI